MVVVAAAFFVSSNGALSDDLPGGFPAALFVVDGVDEVPFFPALFVAAGRRRLDRGEKEKKEKKNGISTPFSLFSQCRSDYRFSKRNMPTPMAMARRRTITPAIIPIRISTKEVRDEQWPFSMKRKQNHLFEKVSS